MGARWYDPSLNRWISPDIIVPDPADPQSLNRFSFVLGNPLRYRDPTGHVEQSPDEGGVDYDDPAVAAYYYELYVSNPELYKSILAQYPNHPSILAAEKWAKQTGSCTVATQHARQAHAATLAEGYDALDQLFPTTDEFDQTLYEFDDAFWQVSDSIDDASEQSRDTTAAAVTQHTGLKGLGKVSGTAPWFIIQYLTFPPRVVGYAFGLVGLYKVYEIKADLQVMFLLELINTDLVLMKADPNCGARLENFNPLPTLGLGPQ